MTEPTKATWGFHQLESLLRNEGLPTDSRTSDALQGLKSIGLTEDQSTAVWQFISRLLADHKQTVLAECVKAIQNLGGITGRD